MTSDNRRVLVAGASGQLGGSVARALLAEGIPVRALGRNAAKLRPLQADGAELSITDLRDVAAVREALSGVDQIVSTANNVMGSGASSPHRVDVAAYRTLTTMARDVGVGRIVHVSARNIGPDSIVDFFRVKHAVDDVIRSSSVPYVLLHFSAFMDVWASVVFGDAARPKAVTLFGGGHRRMNFISVADASRFVVAVVRDGSVVNEIIDIGGPSQATFAEFADIAERALGTAIARRRLPAPVMRIVRVAARPFSERVSRMVSMGYWTTLADRPYAEWREAADRFGIMPCTLESYLGARYGSLHDRGNEAR